MSRFKNLVKGIAKKNILVRAILMFYYAVFFSLRNLFRYLMVSKKKTMACVLVLALIIPRADLGSVNAEEITMSVSGGNAMNQVSGGDASVSEGDSNQKPDEGDNGSVSGGDLEEQPEEGGQVSGGDLEEQPDEDDEEQKPEEDGSGSVSGGDVELPTEEEGAATEDIVYVQQISLSYEDMYTVGELQVGNTLSKLVIRPVALDEAEEYYVRPLIGLYYGYDGQEYYAECTEEGIAVSIPYEYFGSFYCYGVDAEGHTSERISAQVMIDGTAPVISWEEVAINEVRYMRITVQDSGNVLSGIDLTRCFIYGVPAERIHINEGAAENAFGQAVVSSVLIDISLEDLDEANVELSVADHAGNMSADVLEWSAETMADEKQILSVVIPCNINFSMAPWKQDKQIASETLTIINKSECDIYFELCNANIEIVRDNVPDNPSLKNCDIYLETSDGNRYSLPEGDSGELCVVRIPGENSEDGNNTFTFCLDGDMDPNSNGYWRDDDISINITYRFWGIEPEEPDEEETVAEDVMDEDAVLKEETEE